MIGPPARAYIAVKNFERFQHYRDRAPLWIKLYTSLLEDFDFLALSEAAQIQLVKLWLLASRMDNRLPLDRRFLAAQIHSKRLQLDELLDAGFLVPLDPAQHVPVRAPWASRYIAPDVRERVLARTGGKCAACGSSDNVEIDHIIPVSFGGTGAEENLQPLCRRCNRKKRTRSVTAEQLATQATAPVQGSAEPRARPRARGEREREREVENNKQLPSTAVERVQVALSSEEARTAFTELLKRAGGHENFAMNVEALAGVREAPSKIAVYSWAVVESAMIDLVQTNTPVTRLPGYCRVAQQRANGDGSQPDSDVVAESIRLFLAKDEGAAA